MNMIYIVIGWGPNGLEIPLVVFSQKEEAETFIQQFPGQYKGGVMHLTDEFSEMDGEYRDDDDDDGQSSIGKPLYQKLFRDGSYYSGCGGCYSLSIQEAVFGQPLVAWDLD